MLRIISLLVSILVVFNPINTNAESDLEMPAYQKSKVNQTELGIEFGYKGCFSLHSNPNGKTINIIQLQNILLCCFLIKNYFTGIQASALKYQILCTVMI